MARTKSNVTDPRLAVRWITTRDLVERWGVDRTTIYRMVKRGDLPAPVYIATRPRWTLEAVEAFERAQAGVPFPSRPHLRFAKAPETSAAPVP